MAYTLKDWYIMKCRDNGESYSVVGHVYGRHGWEDGKKLRSSEIVNSESKDGFVIIRTQNSEYHCAESDYRFPPKNLDVLKQLLGEETCIRVGKGIMEKEEMAKRELEAMLPGDGGDVLLLSMAGEASYYFRAALIRKNGETAYSTSHYIHSGMLQDSVLIGDGDEWRFRFFPYKGNRLKFYAWDKESEPVYIYNSGSEPLEADCEAGIFLIQPGCVELISEENTEALITEHIAPAIDRYTNWEAHVEEDGHVYYT